LNLNLVLEYTIREGGGVVQVNQDGLKLNGTHHLLVYTDYVTILGGSVHTIKKNTENLVVASKKIGLEGNTERAEYTVLSRYQNTVQNHNRELDNKSFNRVE